MQRKGYGWFFKEPGHKEWVKKEISTDIIDLFADRF